MTCHCHPQHEASSHLRLALTTGDFSKIGGGGVLTGWRDKAIAARAVAATGSLPVGIGHDHSTWLLYAAAISLGLNACTEVKLRHASSPMPCSIDLVIYSPGHTCAGSALMLVEFKPVVGNRYQFGKAVEQVRTYGQRWHAAHGRTPRLVVVARGAAAYTDDDTDDVEVGTPEQFMRELRLMATTLAVAEAAAA